MQGELFLSDKGEVLARNEGTNDLRLTRRLILHARVELNFAAQETPRRVGKRASQTPALRLRYEITREFALYIGVSYDRRFGKTADDARAGGQGAPNPSFVVGIRSFL